jgi:hypothetical protein
MADLIFRVQRVVENEVGVAQDQLKRNGVDVIHGTGKFTDAHHLQVENGNGFVELEGQYIVIATGTKPAANSKVPSTGATSLIMTKYCVYHRYRRRLSLWAAASLASSMPACLPHSACELSLSAPTPARICRYEIVEALSYRMRDHRATMRLNEEKSKPSQK